MIVKNQGEALLVAMDMEKRAIRTYERALLFAEAPQVRQGIEEILRDERQHLKRFTQMWNQTIPSGEQMVLLQAMASDVLFPGGVTEMVREEALSSLLGLYRYAMESEDGAVKTYTEFATKCTGEAKAAFLDIVQEESGHLESLREKVAAMEKENTCLPEKNA